MMETLTNERCWITSLRKDFGTRRSELCKARDFYQDWYLNWCREMGEERFFHRKQWEYVYILQALLERGCLEEGKKGLGFAVGTEPLPSVFAKRGCSILATDIIPEQGEVLGWGETNQLCRGIDSLYKCDIVDEMLFREKVTYKAVDMSDIPDDLEGFDFNWSCCSFEHLGTIEKGISFLHEQMKTLKPGGWAIHTTEYNISSNDETQDNDPTVIYRQRDIDRIVSELREQGHFVEELDYSLGGLPQDFNVDIFPHKQDIHIKLQVNQYVVTSIGLIIRKKPAFSAE